MKNNTLLFAACIALATSALSTATHAQTRGAFGYAGFGGGITKADVDCTGTSYCDRSDVDYKAFAGYMFTRNWGAELSYAGLGKTRATVPFSGVDIDAQLKGSALGAYAVGNLPVGERFDLFAKVGAAYVESKVIASLGTLSGSDKEYTTSAAFGLGASYTVMPGLALRLEWDRYKAKFGDEKSDIDILSLGVRFSMPR